MTTVHNLTTRQNRTWPEEPAMWEAVETLRIGYHRYAVVGWTKDYAGRLVQGGPKVAGPHAGAFGLCTVIAANPIPDESTYVDVAYGDLVSVGGSVYAIQSAPNQNIALERVLGDEPGCGQECACHDGGYNCYRIDPATSSAIFGACACER